MKRYFLAKTDPDTYSLEDLKKDQETNWDGIHSHQALQALKSWIPGDQVLIYHSLGENKIVGLAEVTQIPVKDEADSRGFSWHAKIKFIKEFDEDKKISLKEIKNTGFFNDFALVKQSRLSTMECPVEFVEWLKLKGVL